MRCCVVNLGCKVNRVESDSYLALFAQYGAQVSDAASADCIVINTCTVTGEADKKTRKTLRHHVRCNNHAHIFVTGCSAALHASAFEKLDTRIEVVPKAAMYERLRDYLVAHADTGTSSANASPRECADSAFYQPEHTRIGVKVQDGCNNACTFCIVHVARGHAISKPYVDIEREVVTHAKNGVKEIVLTGINLGSYSDNSYNLASLLQGLLSATKNIHEPGELPCRFRTSSIEPMDISDQFINLMAQSEGRICRHVHIPLQAGSTKVLREMDRPYTAEAFVDLCNRMYEAIPSLSISTDIIVGFPGETDDDFNQTLAVAERCRFSRIHVFPYSMREGTPAALRSDQIDPLIKTARAERLRTTAQELRTAFRDRLEGTTELVVIEEQARAMTESYFEVTSDDGTFTGNVGDLVPFTWRHSASPKRHTWGVSQASGTQRQTENESHIMGSGGVSRKAGA